MGSSLGEAVLNELWSVSWEIAHTRVIEEMGLAFGCHPGLRRKRNEDRVAVAQVVAANNERYAVALVCDGVGGSELGDIAATLTIASILNELARYSLLTSVSAIATDLIKKADIFVRQELSGKGTSTLSMVLISAAGDLAAVNVGDSRVYSWSSGNVLKQISTDDTMENELLGLTFKDAGVLDARGLRGRLSQAVGESGRTANDLRLITFDKEKFLDGGVVLGSDGLWKSAEAGFQSVLFHAASAHEAVRRTIAFANWTGGMDNISVVVIADLNKMAEAITPPIRSAGTSMAITFWAGDTKFTSSEAIVVRKSVPQPNALKLDISVKKPTRKATGRTKSVARAIDDDQLQITDDSVPSKHGNRPEIQVSVDDDKKNK